MRVIYWTYSEYVQETINLWSEHMYREWNHPSRVCMLMTPLYWHKYQKRHYQNMYVPVVFAVPGMHKGPAKGSCFEVVSVQSTEHFFCLCVELDLCYLTSETHLDRFVVYNYKALHVQTAVCINCRTRLKSCSRTKWRVSYEMPWVVCTISNVVNLLIFCDV